MTNMTAREALHHAAKLTLDFAPYDGEIANGICNRVREWLHAMQINDGIRESALSIMSDIMASWPEGTGDPDFPIPATCSSLDYPDRHYAASRQFYIRRSRWTGEQRKLRLALLEYIIAQTAPQEA